MSLLNKLHNLIKEKGPITVEKYMDMCLNDPVYGYYKTQQIFGENGDFTTAPEISQTFGEMIAIWIIYNWSVIYSPDKFSICEMGPGRGTLSKDILRVIKKLSPECYNAAEITLIETSPLLVNLQKEALAEHIAKISWIDDLKDLPQLPTIIVANELFDAIPIQQYVYKNCYLLTRKIGLENGELFFIIDELDKKLINEKYKSFPQNSIIELSPQRDSIAEKITIHLKHNGGLALLFDYGELKPAYGDTLQALQKHKYVSILSNPGLNDLTSHVSFYDIATIAKQHQCNSYGTNQGTFLKRLGIIKRMEVLTQNSSYEQKENLQKGINRLIDPAEMGDLFKVTCISPYSTVPFNFTNQEKII